MVLILLPFKAGLLRMVGAAAKDVLPWEALPSLVGFRLLLLPASVTAAGAAAGRAAGGASYRDDAGQGGGGADIEGVSR
jgi:hypothetical protein